MKIWFFVQPQQYLQQLPKTIPPINWVFIKIPQNNKTIYQGVPKVPRWWWGHVQGWQNGNRDNGDEENDEG